VKIKRKIKSFISLYQLFGIRWLLFRSIYWLRLKIGIIRLQIPAFEWAARPLKYWIKNSIPAEPEKYAQWRKENEPKFHFSQLNPFPKNTNWDHFQVLKEADQYLAGILRYFSKTDYQIGFPPDWLLDPFHNIRIPAEKHWSQISDDGPYDIKFIWEANRLSQIYSLVRAYARSGDQHYPAAFWQILEDWMLNNPPGRGPNWKCGQETTLRLMAVCFGYYAFKDHPQSTPERIAQLTTFVAVSADRIYRNLDYAIFTRSNHTISESFGVWLAGTLFPELRQSGKYRRIGKQIFKKEASKQIYLDGSYAMHSLNYHRFILHIFLFALRIAEVNDQKLSSAIYAGVERSIDYLYELIDPATGLIPVYGSNDGSLVLPLNNCDFQDFRPLIQSGYYAIHRKRIFPPGCWDEDLFWLFGKEALESFVEPKSQKFDQIFPESGLTRIQGQNTVAFVRCGDIVDRPTHADQNHLDIFWQGEAISLDAGTYLYSGAGEWRNGLAKTIVHNTVSVDGRDQMEQFSRFIWVNWSQGTILSFENKQGLKFWQGQHDGYTRLKDPVWHKRSILLLDQQSWLVVDHVSGLVEHDFTLNWLLNNKFTANLNGENMLQWRRAEDSYTARFGVLNLTSKLDVVSADPQSTRGWVSHYYGHKEPASSAQLKVHQKQAIFWSLFSPIALDLVSNPDSLKIQAGHWRVELIPNNILFQNAHEAKVEINPLVENGIVKTI